MKQQHIIHTAILGATLLALAACTDDLGLQGTPTGRFEPTGELVDAYLNLSVSGLSMQTGTRASDDTDAERRINDIWVFQYTQDGGTLINTPSYQTIGSQSELTELDKVPVTLSDNNNEPCIVYVVANTGDSLWVNNASNNYEGFNSLASLKAQTIPNPAPIRLESASDTLSIPMGGSVGEDGELIISMNKDFMVPVQRMFAKLEVYVKLNASAEDYSEASMTSLVIDKILNACTVTTTYKADEENVWDPPANSKFEVTRTFDNPTLNEEEGSTYYYGPFILYVPENLSTTETDAIKLIPYIKATEENNGRTIEILSKPYYTAYPGSWDKTIKSSSEGSNEEYYVKRNCVYVINLTVNMEQEIVTPSANCLIATAGQTIAFYPYVRDEEMSEGSELATLAEENASIKERYTFATYLDSTYVVVDDANDGKKIESQGNKIKSVKIIWQTKGCLGDNKDGDYVWIDPAPKGSDYGGDEEAIAEAMTDAERRRKIYVKTSETGNALIAAYDGEDGTGNILWSWHIWVPEVDPESTALEYYHYAWDSTNGINTNTFVPGRLVMNLNLGALVEKPATRYTHDTNTFGMLYQWGRKDPFPPMKMTVEGTPLYWQVYGFDYQYADCTFSRSQYGYNPTYTIEIGVYDNENKQIDLTNNYGSINSPGGTDVFYTDMLNTKSAQVDGSGEYYYGTLDATDDNAVILSTVQHPTMFIAARAPSSWNIEIGTSDYYYEGDWLPDNDNYLWGGTDPGGSTEYPVYTGSFTADLEDNYGPDKTIFDPCPYGWRVAPGDLWLGFTKDGKNWHYNPDSGISGLDHLDEVNIDSEETGETIFAQHGFNMYMQGWQGAIGSATSFFPNQGIRSASGQPFGDISCGNYHNATVDKVVNNIRRVNIIHFHSNSSYYATRQGDNVFIKVFVDDTFFYEKALGCPLRCVRDTK